MISYYLSGHGVSGRLESLILELNKCYLQMKLVFGLTYLLDGILSIMAVEHILSVQMLF